MLLSKDIQKEIKKVIVKTARTRNIHNIQDILFFRKDDYFLWYLYDLFDSEKAYCRIGIKYYEYDDILWDILDMESNKGKPDSLRANGAFRAPMVRIKSEGIPIYLDDYTRTAEEFLKKIVQVADDFIAKNELDEYISNSDEANDTTLLFISYIHSKQYEKARTLAEHEITRGEFGTFGDIDKSFFELAMMYLDKIGK